MTDNDHFVKIELTNKVSSETSESGLFRKVAPCGLDCFNCELYKTNITSEIIKEIQSQVNLPEADISCNGCRNNEGNHFHLPKNGCETFNCIEAKAVDFCFNCAHFPCKKLAPVADQASRYPHNFKLYNLCRIKKIGLKKWAEEEAIEVRKQYYYSNFIAGKGCK